MPRKVMRPPKVNQKCIDLGEMFAVMPGPNSIAYLDAERHGKVDGIRQTRAVRTAGGVAEG